MILKFDFAAKLSVALRGVILGTCMLLATAAWAEPFAYSVRSDVDDNLYRIDLSTGEASLLGPSGFTKIEGLALSPSGELFAVDPSLSSPRLLKCATAPSASAMCANVGTSTFGLPASSSPVGLSFLPNGELYMAISAAIYLVNPSTGAATLRGSTGAVAIAGLAGRAPTPSCSSGLFALSANASPANLYCVNTTSGALTLLGTVTPSTLDAGLDADATSGLLWEITNATPSQVFSIDPETRVTSTPLSVTINSVPAGGFESLAVLASSTTRPAPADSTAQDIPTMSAMWLVIAAALISALGLVHRRRA